VKIAVLIDRVYASFGLTLLAALFAVCQVSAQDSPNHHFDAAPFGMPLQEGQGLKWVDPRDVHEVIVDFASPLPAGAKVRLEYWGSPWPQQYLPGDRVLGSGFSGWMELGDWYNGGWRVADTRQSISGNSIHFTFAPINAHEYPELTNYSSTGRFTLKIRIVIADSSPHNPQCPPAVPSPLPSDGRGEGQGEVRVPRKVDQTPVLRILEIHALTDSKLADRTVHIAWEQPPSSDFQVTASNGKILSTLTGGRTTALRVQSVVNSDPNTFDRTLVTLKNGGDKFTILVDDLTNGVLYLPEYGAALLPDSDTRDYATVAADVGRANQKTLYERIAKMPEQTWPSAWNGMPPKKSPIEFPLGLDGARQKFRLEPNGNLTFRVYDPYMEAVAGKDTPRLAMEQPPVTVHFGLQKQLVERHIEDESIPICMTTWQRDGVQITQTAFATTLDGLKSKGPLLAPDASAVAMLRFDFTNTTDSPQTATLPVRILSDTNSEQLRIDDKGLIWNGDLLRGQVCTVAQVSKPARRTTSYDLPIWKSAT